MTTKRTRVQATSTLPTFRPIAQPMKGKFNGMLLNLAPGETCYLGFSPVSLLERIVPTFAKEHVGVSEFGLGITMQFNPMAAIQNALDLVGWRDMEAIERDVGGAFFTDRRVIFCGQDNTLRWRYRRSICFIPTEDLLIISIPNTNPKCLSFERASDAKKTMTFLEWLLASRMITDGRPHD